MCESSHTHSLSVSLILLGCTPLCQHAKYIALMSHVWPCARPERRAARRGSRARAREARVCGQLERARRTSRCPVACVNKLLYMCVQKKTARRRSSQARCTLYIVGTRAVGEPVVTGVPRVSIRSHEVPSRPHELPIWLPVSRGCPVQARLPAEAAWFRFRGG